MRRLIGYSLPAFVLLVGSFWAVGPSRERCKERSLPPGATRGSERPFHRPRHGAAESLSLYGYGRETSPTSPGWRDKGVRFEQARAAAAWTLPSHASMFTGRWPHELSARLTGLSTRPIPRSRNICATGATIPPVSSPIRSSVAGGSAFLGAFSITRMSRRMRGDPPEFATGPRTGQEVLPLRQRDRPTAYFDRKDAATINRRVPAMARWHRAARPPVLRIPELLRCPRSVPDPRRAWPAVRPEGPKSAGDAEVVRDWHRRISRTMTPEGRPVGQRLL